MIIITITIIIITMMIRWWSSSPSADFLYPLIMIIMIPTASWSPFPYWYANIQGIWWTSWHFLVKVKKKFEGNKTVDLQKRFSTWCKASVSRRTAEYSITTFSHQGPILIEEILQMLGRVEQYSFTRPSSIKLQCRLGKFRNNVEKGEWVLFSNTSLSHKLRILFTKATLSYSSQGRPNGTLASHSHGKVFDWVWRKLKKTKPLFFGWKKVFKIISR